MNLRPENRKPNLTLARARPQLIAASYLRHGYYWYVTGKIPNEKPPERVDQKLIAKYGIDISEWQRSKRRKSGLANAQYLRCGQWFILMLTEGHHLLRQPTEKGGEGEHIKDCRRIPIRFAGYSISYRRSGVAQPTGQSTKWHAHVRLDSETYAELKAHFESIAVHRSVENLVAEFAKVTYARYAPIRRQLLNILRQVNNLRQRQSFTKLPHTVLNLRRSVVKVYANVDQKVESNTRRFSHRSSSNNMARRIGKSFSR
ncbi:hypothetical protein Pla100_22380 [Neorhodopirellula pilleata]|uniref:Uncharacterized protein n=1 Tax=Neorhodopirellula pilleata TaxID=2714738 RepID=A0A5C6AG90_9BACT|nr:hypothetical protein Pla100_22380 [Neorhodopirellula pilleata]